MESRINSIITTTIFTLGVLWYNNANAADKTESLKGTITLGAAGYGIKLEDGKLIGFMGRGGNKVFATCHNGDTCKITGIVVYNIKKPLFITVKSVQKLRGADRAIANSTSPESTTINAADSAEKSGPVAPPAHVTEDSAQSTPPKAAIKTSAQASSPSAESDNSSPFLLDNNANQ